MTVKSSLTAPLVVFGIFTFGMVPAHALINVPADYATIQEAVDNAGHRETVLVQRGTYFEHILLTEKKDYIIEGVDRDTVIIDGRLLKRGGAMVGIDTADVIRGARQSIADITNRTKQ